MNVLLYPSDTGGCGHYRMIYVGEILAAAGHDVTVTPPQDRSVLFMFNGDGTFRAVDYPPGTDVIVFQRPTEAKIVDAIPWLRARGVSVVIDVDDDLSKIHPSNPVAQEAHPKRVEREIERMAAAGAFRSQREADATYRRMKSEYRHSWLNLETACRAASFVTVSTPGLMRKYVAHGRGRILPNYLPGHFFDVDHVDSDVVCWPAALHAHPNDPTAVGNAIARITGDGGRFLCVGREWVYVEDGREPDPDRYRASIARAFGMHTLPEHHDAVDITGWPRFLAEHVGVGIAPLADTVFNHSKSWLKVIEMSAAGVPWVASPRPEYAKVAADGVGLLADRPKDWYRRVNALRTDPVLRADMSAAGREVMRAKYALADHAPMWLDAWNDAWRIDHVRPPTATTAIVV